MSIDTNQYTYPFDPSGKLQSNLILNEQQLLTPANWRDFHFIIPKMAPFFSDSVKLSIRDTSNNIRDLVEGVDYSFTHHFIDASKSTGQPVYGSISFINVKLAGTIRIEKYQTVGGRWTLSEQALAKILAEKLYNPRTTSWDQVAGMPALFPPTAHDFDIKDWTGAKDIVTSLAQIETAIYKLAEHSYSNVDIDRKFDMILGDNGEGSVAAIKAREAAQSALEAANSALAALAARDVSNTAAANAQSSATVANAKAQEIVASATTASTKASEASQSAASAATKATQAANSATAAATSATNAANSLGAITTKANEAAASASQASAAADRTQINADSAAAAATTAQTGAQFVADSITDVQVKTADALNAASAATEAANRAAGLASEAVISLGTINEKLATIETLADETIANAASAAAAATSAADSATSAAQSASSSSISASNAGSSATAAATSASTASTKATEATGSANTAASKATAASTSASQAATSASNASTSASGAATSATAAANSASDAANSATNASSAAGTATSKATAAGSSATAAATSATNAANSAAAAAASALNATRSIDKVYTNAAVSGTLQLDLGVASVFELTLAGISTLAYKNAPALNSEVLSIVIRLAQGATAYSFGWWSNITWLTTGGTAPTAPAAGKAVEYILTTNDGTNWIGRKGSSN